MIDSGKEGFMRERRFLYGSRSATKNGIDSRGKEVKKYKNYGSTGAIRII